MLTKDVITQNEKKLIYRRFLEKTDGSSLRGNLNVFRMIDI